MYGSLMGIQNQWACGLVANLGVDGLHANDLLLNEFILSYLLACVCQRIDACLISMLDKS